MGKQQRMIGKQREKVKRDTIGRQRKDVLQKRIWCWYIHRVFQGNWKLLWEGPLEVVERVSETTYKLALPADRHSYIQTDDIHRLKL